MSLSVESDLNEFWIITDKNQWDDTEILKTEPIVKY